MRNTYLDRPWPKVCHVLSLTNGYRSILVPHDFPIRGGRFVEQDATYSEAFLAEYGDNEFPDGLRTCKLAHYRNVQQISLSVLCVVKV
jgi:hypothetical protein